MQTYKILAIGNSFSEDATHFLHQIAMAAKISTKVVNLYIGGCSLEQHWTNIERRGKAYSYQLNGVHTDRCVCIDEILSEEPWDFIVTQQASHDSGWMDTYEPFLGWIVRYLRDRAPTAKLFLQETWAYDVNSTHDRFARYDRKQDVMYQRLRDCYREKARQYKLPLIPCGDVIQELRKLPVFDVLHGGLSLCRDGFHMSYGYGRYAVACTWLTMLFGAEKSEILKKYDPTEWNNTELAQADGTIIADIHRVIRSVCN